MVGRGIVVALALGMIVPAWAAAETCGDADGSGAISVTDGVQALRAGAGLESNCSSATCDVDASGVVTVTDGVLILRLAAGLEAPTACAAASPLSVSMRQAINNNPYRSFGDLTKAGAEGEGVASRAEPIVIADDQTGSVHSAVAIGQGIACPVSGFQALVACQQAVIGGTGALVSTIQFQQCTTQTATGFIRQDGIIQETIPGARECILFTQSMLPIGQEIIEERQGFTSEFFDGSAALVERQVETLQQIIAYLEVCEGDLGGRFPSNMRRELSGSIAVTNFNEDGDAVGNTLTYSDVAFTRLYSSSCETHTTTLQAGTIETSDQRFGETYRVGLDDLQYALASGGGSALDLTLEGSLESNCGEDQQTFTYETLDTAIFDPAGDGCPRGGTFEVKSGDEVLGQITFTATGGVTLTPTSGQPRTFASCNDPALRLQCGE